MQENELVRFVPLLGDRIAAINEAKKSLKDVKLVNRIMSQVLKKYLIVLWAIVGNCGRFPWTISIHWQGGSNGLGLTKATAQIS